MDKKNVLSMILNGGLDYTREQIEKDRKKYFDLCDRLYLNKLSLKKGNSKTLVEQIEKDEKEIEELKKLLF